MPIPRNNNGSIMIRFAHNRYKFVLGQLGRFDDPIALGRAKLICRRIEIDIEAGTFVARDNIELAIAYHPEPQKKLKPKLPKRPKQSPKPPSLLELLDNRLDDYYHSTDKALLNHLKQYGKPIKSADDAQKFILWLQKRPLAASTVQRYLNTLKALSPLFTGIKIKSEPRKPIKPFSKVEVTTICGWFEQHHPHYADFIFCLFATGMRTSEAIGLQWNHVDFDRNLLTISESLTSPGRNGQRVRKSTKTGIPRYFPLSGKLLALLKRRYLPTVESGALIFSAPNGKPIDDHNFSQRYWRTCLSDCGIQHRSLYHTRHTFISHALSAGLNVVEITSLTHGSRSGAATILKHYAGLINPVDVPELF